MTTCLPKVCVNMYKSFLSWEMGVEKMVLYILADGEWQCTTAINHGISDHEEIMSILLPHKKTLHHQARRISDSGRFDIIILYFTRTYLSHMPS